MLPTTTVSIVDELAAAFGSARDVTPGPDQPLHVLLESVPILEPWTPRRARALVQFTNWPDQRPQFWIDIAVRSSLGGPPVSSSEQYVLGEAWRQFSFQFEWPAAPATPTRAVQLWLNRFREQA
jgi:hypothetical protein